MNNKNSIFTIAPYKFEGQWVFDDERVGLVREALVAGADDLLDILCKGVGYCVAIFSENSFPDHQVVLTLKNTSPGGSGYYCEKYEQDVWLCPALFLYFEEAPKTIFLKVKV